MLAQRGDHLLAGKRLLAWQQARLSLDNGKPEQAEKFARDAIQIDVQSDEARKALIEALKGQGKTAEVEKLEKRFAQ